MHHIIFMTATQLDSLSCIFDTSVNHTINKILEGDILIFQDSFSGKEEIRIAGTVRLINFNEQIVALKKLSVVYTTTIESTLNNDIDISNMPPEPTLYDLGNGPYLYADEYHKANIF